MHERKNRVRTTSGQLSELAADEMGRKGRGKQHKIHTPLLSVCSVASEVPQSLWCNSCNLHLQRLKNRVDNGHCSPSLSQHTIVFCGLLSVLNYRICHPLGTLLVAQEAVEQQRTEHIVGSKRSQVLRVKVEVTER